jgi:hypothetical protein
LKLHALHSEWRYVKTSSPTYSGFVIRRASTAQ